MITDGAMSAERALRYVAHEAARVRGLAYVARSDSGPDRDMLEAALLVLPALLKVCRLAEMDDIEAASFSFQLKQALIGLNAHDNEQAA